MGASGLKVVGVAPVTTPQEAAAVWMSPYTRAQFPDPPETLCTAEDPLDRAGPGELCFAETADPAPSGGG